MLAAAALVRHAGVAAPLSVATTTYVAADADLDAAADALDCTLVVTDPGFEGRDDPLARYAAGEAKEGAGMGGALLLAERAGALEGVADGTLEVVERVDDSYGP
jgi:NaMN:DMB phosphoribosyltransferase